MILKDFESEFYNILDLLKLKIPFAFNRFSDGELFILKNMELVLDQNIVKVGSNETIGEAYQKEDFKRFSPEEHAFYRDRLMDAFMFQEKNYFKGISCRCCIGKEDFVWQLNTLNQKKLDPYLTWANLLVNGNYSKFIHLMVPQFLKYKLVVICNENANLTGLGNIAKEFRVGYNAMINNYPLIETIKKWIEENDIENHLFLFSASSFSKMAIHQLFENYKSNTYIDVGTTLNPFWGMRLDRSYLGSFWQGKRGQDIQKLCIW